MPDCLAAREVRSGRSLTIGGDELWRLPGPPYSVGPDSLLVGFDLSETLACHLALKWPIPGRLLDLAAESRCLSAGLLPARAATLQVLLSRFGADSLDAIDPGAASWLLA